MHPSRHSIVLLVLILALLGMFRPAAPIARGAAPLTAADQAAIRALLPPATQAYLKASNTDPLDGFGYSVAVDGDTVAVGALVEDSAATGVGGNQSDNSAAAAGAVYVFVRTEAGWTQQAYLKASNTDAADRFGDHVALSGDTLLVGAAYESSAATGVGGDQADNSASHAGAAYVFTRTAGVWTQQAYLKASNAEAEDLFGYSVALDGDTAVVGAIWEDSAATGVNGDQANNGAPYTGAAYVFERASGVWSQTAYLKPHAPAAALSHRTFGERIAISGTAIAVGAPNGGGGHAYVFERVQGAWTAQATIPSPGEDGGRFGWSVALDGTTLAVGAPLAGMPASGRAYVFVRSGSTWSQQAVLVPANGDPNDWFGIAVALSGDRVLVGANWEDSAATGFNGNQQDNGAADAGAAYLFVRAGATWTQQAYLKAPNTDAGDEFGYGVALDGSIIAIGATNEDSAATGINGDQQDNSAMAAGAVYLFDGDLPVLPTATPTSTATATGIPTATATATAPVTGTPTATTTPPERSLYLPLVLR